MFRQWMFFIVVALAIATPATWAQPTRHVSISQLSLPESMIYFLLRNRTGGPTDERANLERNLQLFRAYAHDRRRQVDMRWLTPLDYERRREAFRTLCREAQDHFRQATGKRDATHREKLTRSRHRAAGQAKLHQAADAWADPILRRFLLGAAALEADDFGRAESLFAQCTEEEPHVAAFLQGRAQALMGLKRYSEALRTYMQVLSMRPDSRQAVQILRQALKDSPGSNIKTPAFREAKKMLQDYSNSSAKRSSRLGKTTGWLFPGKAVRSKDHSLPDLPMDHLVVRQAVGTPVAEHTLLLDGRILQDTDEVLVQIDPKTLAPASFRKTFRHKEGQTPMTLITVPDYTFTPVPRLYGDPKSGDSLTAYTVNVFTEMGGTVRRQPMKVLTDQTGYITDPNPALVNGESAGILLTDKGELAGVVMRDLDVMKDSPAQNVYVTPDLAPLLKQIRNTTSRRRSRRKTKTKDAPGQVFTVYAVQGERFGEK